MGKTSTLPGRSAPPSKKSSSSITKSKTTSFSKNNESTVKKAIKLETKRNSIQKKSRNSNPISNNKNRFLTSSIDNKGTSFGPSKGFIDSLPPTNLSKSSLRRFKRKEKEELGGNKNGMKDVKEAIEIVQEGGDELDGLIEDEDENEKGKGKGKSNGNGNGGSSKVGAKKRKEVLSQELIRQPSILKDPSFSSNPFQALRQHARNTLTFDGPVEKLKPGKKRNDDDMEL